MILSDRDIFAKMDSGELIISSDNKKNSELRKQVHASSMDLRLGKYFKIYKHSEFSYLDPKKLNGKEELTDLIEINGEKPFIIQPGEFILAVTEEKVKIPNDIVARVEGRSSIGRLGIIIHTTAGFIDAGFEGTITLEICNLNRLPVALYPGQRVCQLAFEQMSSPAIVPYGEKKCSKYQNQILPEESKIMIDPEFV